jgi:hypothetical protein
MATGPDMLTVLREMFGRCVGGAAVGRAVGRGRCCSGEACQIRRARWVAQKSARSRVDGLSADVRVFTSDVARNYGALRGMMSRCLLIVLQPSAALSLSVTPVSSREMRLFSAIMSAPLVHLTKLYASRAAQIRHTQRQASWKIIVLTASAVT